MKIPMTEFRSSPFLIQMNEFIEKLLAKAGFIKTEKAAVPKLFASAGVDPFTIWRTQKKIDPARALEAYSNWVYAAIKAIAVEVSSIDFKLFRTGKKNDEQIFDHPLLNVLSAVNDYQTGLELFYLTAAHLEAVGNSFWYLEGVEKETDQPLAIHVMVPSKVKVIANREEFPTRIQGYQYTLGSRIYTFQPYQVLHIKYPDPNDPIEGIGTVQSIGQWIDADNYAMEFNRRFFLNGARVGGIIQSDAALTPAQIEYLKTAFEAAFKGVENAYKILALPKGTEYKEAGQTQKDMDFSGLSLSMRDRIIAGFKVPRTALGITDDVNRANAEATDYVFAARTIKPIMRFITSYLNEFLVPRYGEDIYLSFTDPVPEDRAQTVDENTKSLGNAPWKTVNEVRAEEGYEPVPGGDVVQAPFNFMPVGGSSADITPPKQANGKEKTIIRTRFAINARRRQALSKGIAEKAAAEIVAIFKGINEVKEKGIKNIATLNDDQYEAVYKGFAMRVDRYERKQRAVIQDFNATQKKEVIGNIPKIAKGFFESKDKAIKNAELFDKDLSMTALVDLSEPIFYDLAGKEGAEAAGLLGIEGLDILSPEVRRALDRSLELLSQSYNETTLLLLKDKLNEGLRQGLSQAELTDLVNGVYDYSDEVRAAQVARTETFRIANYATQEAWKQSGVVTAQKWYTAADERVCPYCAPQHGKVVSLDENFFKKGDVVQGSDGSTINVEYSDVGAPPLHVSCRCYIRPEGISLE
jgi:HK97 family phage portal protein